MALNNLGLGFIFTAKDLASGVIQKIHGNLGKVEGKATGFGSAAGAAFKSFGVGMATAGVGLAALASLSPAIEESKALSKAIALVATESDEATFPQERMRDIAEKLAVQYGNLPVDEAKAMYKAVALGANDAAKAQDFLNGVNLLAVAGDADLITTTNALGGVLNAYGESFDKATAYGESFFTAMRMGNTTVQDLSASIGRVAPTAKTLNISFDELIGAVSVMTNKGIQASEAVSGIKEALANIIHPAHDAQAEAARLGIKFSAAALRSKGSFQAFIKGIMDSPKFTADSFSKLFTSVEGSAAVINIASNAGKDYAAVLDAMKDKAGSTKKGFEIMAATLDYQQKKFEANKAVVLGMIGKALEPLAAGVLRVVNTILTAFSKAPKPVIAFATKLFAATALFVTFVGGILATKAALVLFAFAMKAVGATAVGVLLAFAPVIAAIALVGLAFYGLREAYRRNLGGFADFVDSAVKKATLAFEALQQVFSSGAFSGDVMRDLNKAENSGIKSFAINVFLWVNRIKNFISSIGDGFSQGLGKAQGAIEVFKTALTRLGAQFGFISEKGTAASNVNKWNAFGEAGMKVGNAIAQGFAILIVVIARVMDIVRGVTEVWGSMGGVVEGVKATFVGLGDAISMLLQSLGLMQQGTDNAQNGWTALGNVIGASASLIAGAIGIIVTAIRIVVSVVAGVVSAVRGLLSGLADIFTGIAFVIGGIITGKWSDVWMGAKLIVFGIVDGIQAALGSLVGIVAGVLDSIGGMFGKDWGLQKGMERTVANTHNNLGKKMGVLDVSGKRETFAAPPAPAGAPAGPAPLPIAAPGAKPVLGLPPAPGTPLPAPTAGIALPPGEAARMGEALTTAIAPVKQLNDRQVAVLTQILAAVKEKGPTAAQSFTPTPVPT